MKGHNLSLTIPKPYLIGGSSTIVRNLLSFIYTTINLHLPYCLSDIPGVLVNNIVWANNYSLHHIRLGYIS